MDTEFKNGCIYSWAVVTPFPDEDENHLNWYFHRVQKTELRSAVLGRYIRTKGYIYQASIEPVRISGFRLRTHKKMDKVSFQGNSSRTLALLSFHTQTDEISIMSATPVKLFEGMISLNPEYRYLLDPRAYRVEFNKTLTCCTDTMEGLVKRVSKEYKVENKGQLFDILNRDTTWYIKDDGDLIKLPETPFLARCVANGVCSG